VTTYRQPCTCGNRHNTIMTTRKFTVDRGLLVIFILIIIGLPIIISAYNQYQVHSGISADNKVFTLTGSVDFGWLKGEVSAIQMLALDLAKAPAVTAVIEVNKGDEVVLRLISNDVVHGFSMKGYSIFVNEGIEPGKPTIVSFIADKPGDFIFSCNAICGKNHETMQGVLRVRA
jgi:heme/copper-type cytochrome/quinol oxidase subunit 2